MADNTNTPLINLVPVGLREAAIDSPSARATVVHYGEQIELLERWLDEYCRATGRLAAEASTLESILANFSSHALVPAAMAESMLDHDYDLLAMKKYAEGANDFWKSMVSVVKRLNSVVIEPIRVFLANDVRTFKETRRAVEVSQKNFDSLHARYAGLAKSKEPSSLREEAFQLHEARKQYVHALMDLTALAPQFRFALDKLLVRVFYDQWKEMRASRDSTAATFQRAAPDMERVRGWLSEMETTEKAFRRELNTARKQLEDAAEARMRPSRELDDYTSSTAASSSATVAAVLTPSLARGGAAAVAEKQAYLYLRTYSGRPTRAVWLRRWAFVRNGVFGWLLQGARPGDVVESERIGVLLCNVRPAPAEERRFCFELKTNKHTILLQAESQADMMDWMTAVQTAKSKALEDPGALGTLAVAGRPHADPAFAISQPPIPEFGTHILTSTEPGTSTTSTAADDLPSAADRSGTLPLPLPLPLPDQIRDTASVDLPRRTIAASVDDQGHHTSRLLTKLTSKSTTPTSVCVSSNTVASLSPAAGGIASLIAASHGSMPVGPSVPLAAAASSQDADRAPRYPFSLAFRDTPASSLAPSTLVNTPVPTNLSKPAVVMTGERGLSAALDKSGLPNSLVANTWGCFGAALVNRLDRAAAPTREQAPGPELASSASLPRLVPAPAATRHERSGTVSAAATPPSAAASAAASAATAAAAAAAVDPSSPNLLERSRSASPTKRPRNLTISTGHEARLTPAVSSLADFPASYPVQLKVQDAQFRLLFPTVKRDERVVLVFRATWNPNDVQEFPGRIYLTTHDMYFYSNHLGLVLASTVSLASIDEATAAPGRECDFLFLHLKEGSSVDNKDTTTSATTTPTSTRITIKTFLDPLRLLQRRINFLVRNSTAAEPLSLEHVIRALIKMETEPAQHNSPSLESWEDVAPDTPSDPNHQASGRAANAKSAASAAEYRAAVRVDHGLRPAAGAGAAAGVGTAGSNAAASAAAAQKFKLPAHAVKYTPPGNLVLAVEREFDVSPKALFHVMFGDKATLWQLLQYRRGARNLSRGPWMNLGEARLRRDFEYVVARAQRNVFGMLTRSLPVRDYQTVDVLSDHLCYVVTDKRTPWELPMRRSHWLVSKIVITHVAKRKCKLAIFVKVEWLYTPLRALFCAMVERQGLQELQLDALDLADLVTDRVRTLGAHSMTRKAIQLFGPVGQSTEISHLHLDDTAAAGTTAKETKGAEPLSLDLRRPIVHYSLVGLLLREADASARALLATLIDALAKLGHFLGTTLAAHRPILALLALSLLANALYTSREAMQRYREGRAAHFMQRVVGFGVGDSATVSPVLSRAVYLADLDDIAAVTVSPSPYNDSDAAAAAAAAAACYDVFADEYGLTGADNLVDVRSSSSSSPSARRVQRTRQRIAVRRHDLLTALRVVNAVEREVVRSEWDRWAGLEAARCRAVHDLGLIPHAPTAGGDGDDADDEDEDAAAAVIGEWYQEYCRSCQAAAGAAAARSGHLG